MDELHELHTIGRVFATAREPNGRNFKVMINILTADLPASRKVCPGSALELNTANVLQATALAGHSASWFCHLCGLQYVDRGNFDMDSWPSRSWATIKKGAKLWKAAKLVKDKEAIFKQYGVRWCEALEMHLIS